MNRLLHPLVHQFICPSLKRSPHSFALMNVIPLGHSWIHAIVQHTSTYHDTCDDCYTPATVRIWDDVSVSDGEEGDGNEPHGVQDVLVFFFVMSARKAKNDIHKDIYNHIRIDIHIDIYNDIHIDIYNDIFIWLMCEVLVPFQRHYEQLLNNPSNNL